MENRNLVLSLLVSLIFVSNAAAQVAMAQSPELETITNSRDADAVAAARNQYTHNEAVDDPKHSGTNPSDKADGKTTLAQLSRRGPGLPYPRSAGYPGAGSARMWQPSSGRHAAIGALIGFGLGAAVGAKANTDQHEQARVAAPLIFGGFGALFGALVGASIPDGPGWRFHRRRPWSDEEEDEMGSSSKAHRSDQRAGAQFVPSKPAADQQGITKQYPVARLDTGRFVDPENPDVGELHLK